MFSSVALSLFVAFVIELFVLAQVAEVFGALATALAVVVLSMIGMAYLRSRTTGVVRASVDRLRTEGSLDKDDLADRTLTIFAGVLLVVPGFVSALVALALLLPPVRGLVRPLVLTRFANSPLLNLRFGRTVVDVDVADVARKPSDPPSSARPELG